MFLVSSQPYVGNRQIHEDPDVRCSADHIKGTDLKVAGAGTRNFCKLEGTCKNGLSVVIRGSNDGC
jgi:hypothetical protein